MNRILFDITEIGPDGRVRLCDARAAHIREVLRLSAGAEIRTGVLNGLGGVSRVLEVTATHVLLATDHNLEMAPSWFDLLLAAPRPKVLKRLLPQLAALGVGRVVVVNAAKVEKCYFSTHWLQPSSIRPLLIEGLTQAGRTELPEIMVRMRLKPFLENEVLRLFPDALRLLAHPAATCAADDIVRDSRRPLLAVGPEGGWTDAEQSLFDAHGFRFLALGSNTLRTDTACVALIAVLCWMRNTAIRRRA